MRSPFLTGLLHPLSLLTLGLSLVAGLLVAWWLFPLGLVLWLVMAANVSRDPSLRLSHKMQSRTPLAQRFQRYFDRIERSQVSIFNSLASAPDRTRQVLQPIQTEVDALTAQVYALCQRMTTLENYRLVTESSTNLQSELQHVDDAIANAGDPLVRKEYEESRRVLLERVAKLKLVSTELDRVEAQLLSLSNEIDGVLTEVVRLQALGPEEAGLRTPVLVERLQQERAELEGFQQEVVEL